MKRAYPESVVYLRPQSRDAVQVSKVGEEEAYENSSPDGEGGGGAEDELCGVSLVEEEK